MKQNIFYMFKVDGHNLGIAIIYLLVVIGLFRCETIGWVDYTLTLILAVVFTVSFVNKMEKAFQ
jgi:hypothetical protein